MKSTDTTTQTCNSLLRGELSAIETYGQAIKKFGGTSGDCPLVRIREDHASSAETLRELIWEAGGAPATGSGSWGTFANAVEGTASLLGESPALAVLKEGEKHGIAEYENALNNGDFDEAIKVVIRGQLLPALRGHLVELEQCNSKID